MKVIDILNKIANGEEVPEKIKFNNTGWYRKIGEKNVYYINDYCEDLFLYVFGKNLDFTLNDEVEIIEENKNIGKLDLFTLYEQDMGKKEILQSNFRDIKDKINEIIDYLNNKEKENE